MEEEPVTYEQAIADAVRLLRAAEMELDLKKMERLDELAHSWIDLAGLIHEHERT